MSCPYCGQEHTLRALHGHLVEEHPDRMQTGERGEHLTYEVTCPVCSEQYRRAIRKTARDPEFVVEFERQIRLVAFDMLITHLRAEHGPGEPTS